MIEFRILRQQYGIFCRWVADVPPRETSSSGDEQGKEASVFAGYVVSKFYIFVDNNTFLCILNTLLVTSVRVNVQPVKVYWSAVIKVFPWKKRSKKYRKKELAS